MARKEVKCVLTVGPYTYKVEYEDGTSSAIVIRFTFEEIQNKYGMNDGKDRLRFGLAIILAVERNMEIRSAYNLVIANNDRIGDRI